jgi:hypothetical protein
MDDMSSTPVPTKKIRVQLQGPTKVSPRVGSNNIGQAHQYHTFAFFFFLKYIFSNYF